MNTRPLLIKEQVNSAIDHGGVELNQSSPEARKSKSHSKTMCKFENAKKCTNRKDCRDFHPTKTCLSFSKLGTCPLESVCEHRHPEAICYDWQQYARCRNGDLCRFRHPIECLANYNNDHFLGQNQEHHHQQQTNWSPKYRDLRGNRW